MKIRLHVTKQEKMEVIDPKTNAKVVVNNLTLEPTPDGHEDGTFATSPSGVIHLNNLSDAAAAAFQVGSDYIISPATGVQA